MDKIDKTGFASYFKKFGGKYWKSFVVYEKEKIIFMKVGKCAGTSVHSAMNEILSMSLKCKIDHKPWLKSLTDEKLKEYFVFALARNPWDRVVSVSEYFGVPIKNILLSSNITQAVRSHSLPCSMFSYNNGVRFADYIIRFENIDEDFKELCAIAKIKHVPLKKLRVTPHDHYSTYYTNNLKELVKSAYRSDIDIFNYKFQKK